MIKKIHQIWFQGEKNIPSKYNKYINSVKNKNPGWDYKLHDESDILKYAARFSQKCLDKFKIFISFHGGLMLTYVQGSSSIYHPRPNPSTFIS